MPWLQWNSDVTLEFKNSLCVYVITITFLVVVTIGYDITKEKNIGGCNQLTFHTIKLLCVFR